MNPSDAADLLYGLPLEEFTARRNALASESDAADAAVIRALPKPSAAAWVLDLLVRADPSALEPLVDVGARLRDTQSSGDHAALSALSADRRRLVADVAGRAIALGADAGHRVAGAAADSVRETLQAVVADPDAAAAVSTGRLTRALRTAGFDGVDLDGAVAGSAVAPLPRPSRAERDDHDRADAVAAAERAIAHSDEVTARLERLRLEQDALDRTRLDLESELEELTDRVAEVEGDLQAVDRDIRSLRSERERADRAAAAARRTAERALARLTEFD